MHSRGGDGNELNAHLAAEVLISLNIMVFGSRAQKHTTPFDIIRRTTRQPRQAGLKLWYVNTLRQKSNLEPHRLGNLPTHGTNTTSYQFFAEKLGIFAIMSRHFMSKWLRNECHDPLCFAAQKCHILYYPLGTKALDWECSPSSWWMITALKKNLSLTYHMLL